MRKLSELRVIDLARAPGIKGQKLKVGRKLGRSGYHAASLEASFTIYGNKIST